MIVIQPAARGVHPRSEDLVRNIGQVARDGEHIEVIRAFGSIGVDRVRCQLTSSALSRTPRQDEIFFLDSDVWTTVEGVIMLRESLRRTGALFMCSAAVCRGTHELNIRPCSPGVVEFGPGGGIIETEKANFACTIVRREFFERMDHTLPEVSYQDSVTGDLISGRPYFVPMVRCGTHYGEDYSCALRARDVGIRLYCDTRVPTWHAVEEELPIQAARGVVRQESA